MNRTSFLAPLASLVLAVTIACNATPPLESHSNGNSLPDSASLVDQCSLRPCTWNQMGQQVSNDYSHIEPSLAVSAGVPVVAYLESTSSQWNAYARVWNGTGWGNATKLNDLGPAGGYPVVAANTTTQIVAFPDHNAHNAQVIRLKTRSSSGAWVAFDPVSDQGFHGLDNSYAFEFDLRLVLDADSLPILVWQEKDYYTSYTFARRYRNGAWQNLGALPNGAVCECSLDRLSTNSSETYLSNASQLWHLDSSDHFTLSNAPYLSEAEVDSTGAPVEKTVDTASGKVQLWRLSGGAWVHLGPPAPFGGQQGLSFFHADHWIIGNTIWAVGSYYCIPQPYNPNLCDDATSVNSRKLRFMRYNGTAWSSVGTAFALPEFWDSYTMAQWPNGNPIIATYGSVYSWGLTPLSNGVFDNHLHIEVVGAPAHLAKINVNGPSLSNVTVQDDTWFKALTPGTYTITAQGFTVNPSSKFLCKHYTPTVPSQTAVVVETLTSTATVTYTSEWCTGP